AVPFGAIWMTTRPAPITVNPNDVPIASNVIEPSALKVKIPGPLTFSVMVFCVVRFVKLTMSAPATICLTSAPFWLTKLIVYSPLITGWARNGNEQTPVMVRVGTGEGVRVTVSAIAAELMTTDAPIAQAAANSLFIGHP